VAVGDRDLGGAVDAGGARGARGRLKAFRADVRAAARDFSPAERKLLLPLAAAGFFEQYDTALLTLGATDIAHGLSVSIGTFGIGVAIIRLGALGGVPVLRLADRLGRRTLLLVSLAAFTLVTGSLAAFIVVQTLARVFLATEHNLSSIVVAEEVRPDRRGAALSFLGWIATVGPGLVALLLILVPLTPLGWRIFYVFALIPLAIVAWLRRQLQETEAFRVASAERRIQPTLWPRIAGEHRRDLWLVCAFCAAFGVVQTPFFLFGSDLAKDTYHWHGAFTGIVMASGLATFGGFYLGGRVTDRRGRRYALAAGLSLTSAGTLLVFSHLPVLFVPGWFCAVGGYACLNAVVLAYLAELFPTEVRAGLTAVAVTTQVVAGSVGLGIVAGLGSLIGRSTVMVLLGVAILPALALLRALPETVGRDVVRAPAGDATSAPIM
jgi:MHS family alpha-ketoglutarate permease-like MFS transporter